MRLDRASGQCYAFDVDTYCQRFEAFGWQTIGIDGHDFDEILPALDQSEGFGREADDDSRQNF